MPHRTQGGGQRHRRPAAGTWLTALALGFVANAASVQAEIGITGARITQGVLWVVGRVDEPNARITLDNDFVQTTDGSGRFEFRVVHHPATCIVTLRTPTQTQRAVVGECGQMGPQGVAGAPGPAGPAGPPGPPGPAGSQAVAALPDPPPAPLPPARTPPTGRTGTPETASPRTSDPAAVGPSAPPEGARPPSGTEVARLPPAPPAATPPAPPAPPPGPPPPPVVGEWLVEDGVARIAIQPCGRSVCGAVSWSKGGGDIGTEILRDMKPTGPNKWEGTIRDPQSGRSYASNISLQNQNTLRVEGCVLGVLCGGQTWTRAK